MKRIFVKDIQAGASVEDIFALAEKSVLQKKDGSNYLSLVLADKTGRIKAVMWDPVDTPAKTIRNGDFIRIQGAAGEYRGKLQVVIKKIEAVLLEDSDPADFLPIVSTSGWIRGIARITGKVVIRGLMKGIPTWTRLCYTIILFRLLPSSAI